MLMYVGVGLALGNWLSLLSLFVATAGSYLFRVKVEEQALLAEIGEPYREFMRTRKRFIPFVV
jgi:protein-S-isoprenylcysteine O-methyltransferase Ste14